MDTLAAIGTVAFVIGGSFAVFKLFELWNRYDQYLLDSEILSFQKMTNDQLLGHHNALIDLIASGKRKPEYFRKIEAVKRGFRTPSGLNQNQHEVIMEERPDRGRVVIVNFEIAGTATPPEMNGTARPCLVVQNNKLRRGSLVTVIPLSSTPPTPCGKQHHRMSHLSFRDLPISWEPGKERWAKCDYVTTVALSRCKDPYTAVQYGNRKYVKVKAIKADMDSVDKCLLWVLSLSEPSD